MFDREDEHEDVHEYSVVVNDDEQYSIWRKDKALPAGWMHAGFSGSRAACIQHVGDVWRDITPRSVRERSRS